MKGLLAAILFAVFTGSTPPVQDPCETHQYAAIHQEDGTLLARASAFRAVCSKGDLNATFTSRADAVAAAQAHQKATGHQTSVRKI